MDTTPSQEGRAGTHEVGGTARPGRFCFRRVTTGLSSMALCDWGLERLFLGRGEGGVGLCPCGFKVRGGLAETGGGYTDGL